MKSRLRPAAVLVVAALAVGVAGCASEGGGDLFVGGDAAAEADYEFTIPAGAGEALDRGEPLQILPGEMEVRVGEIIRIVNDDARGHIVGPFYVGAGEIMTQRFASPGEFVGICTVHPSGELQLVVRQ